MYCGAASRISPNHHPVTCGLIAVVLVLSAISAVSIPARHALVLIWNHTFMTQFYVWNVLTSSFVETSLLKLTLSVAGFAFAGPAVEEDLGMLTMGVVLLACGGVSGVVASVGIFVAYIITRDEYLLDLEIHGTLGVIAALLVALAFREPKAPLLGGPTGGGGQPWPMTRLGAPLILLTLSAAARACGVREGGVDFPFAVVGAYFTWGYLRFFHGFLKPLCDFSYGVFLLLGFFQDRAARVPVPVVDSEGGLAALPVTLPLPEARDPVAQRRRARAMKLLDEKFAKLSANSTQSKWEDEGGGLGDEHLPPARSRTPPPGLTVATAPASALPAGANSSSAAMASDAAKGSSLASSGDLRIGAQKNPCLLGDDDNEDWGEQDT